MVVPSSEPRIAETQRLFEGGRWLFVIVPVLGFLWGSVSEETFSVILQLTITLTAAYICGCLIGLIPRIPPLLGMMLAGAFLKNLNLTDLPPTLSASLRSMALTVILLRAGLGLDLSVLKKLSTACLRLTFMPCFAEAFSIAIVSHFLLNLPYIWGLLLGFVLAAVSPAVIVPAMIDLNEKKLGTGQGIPTLLMAASSFDDVAAITGFGVVLVIIFSGEGNSLVYTLAAGPVEAALGLLVGVLIGVILGVCFRSNRKGKGQFDLACSLHLIFLGASSIFVSNKLGFTGIGPLAVITASAMAVVIWKKQASTSEPSDVAQIRTCDRVLSSLWVIFEPVLFSMIGMEVQLHRLTPSTVSMGLLTLGICLAIRILVTFVAVSWTSLTISEKFFVCTGWLPKATVQAALAPTALDTVRKWTEAGKAVEENALINSETILTVGVLAIMVTAPIGAVAISILGPRLLKQEKIAQPEEDVCLEDGGSVERSK